MSEKRASETNTSPPIGPFDRVSHHLLEPGAWMPQGATGESFDLLFAAEIEMDERVPNLGPLLPPARFPGLDIALEDQFPYEAPVIVRLREERDNI